MLGLKLLPWEYGVRNLLRRPWRSGLTMLALTTVILLVLVVVGFVRGLERSLAASGDPQVALVYAHGMAENLEYSSIAASTADVLASSLGGVETRFGHSYAAPELYLGARISTAGSSDPKDASAMSTAVIRGVTQATILVRRQMEITAGNWPGPGEVLVGRLAATKIGCRPERLAVGRTLTIEGRPWRISGQFAARGSMLESEIWCPLADLQQALKRQDVSLVALTLMHGHEFAELDLFCKERRDLELQAVRESDYYAALTAHYRPVRMLAWLLVVLVAGAGVFAALNTMYAAVVGRVRELATLQTVGFLRRAIAVSVVQEALLLSIAGALAASLMAVALVSGMAVRFTMGAFALCIDSQTVLIGCAAGATLGFLGATPPAASCLRLPIVEGLKAV